MLLLSSYRQVCRKGGLWGLFLLRGRKSVFSPSRGDSLHRFMWNFASPRGIWVRLAVLNFTSIGTGLGTRHTKFEIFHFLVKIRPAAGNSLTDLLQVLVPFIRPTTLHKVLFKFDVIRFSVYGVIAEKLRVSHLPRIFSAPRRKNCVLDRKMITPFRMVSTSSSILEECAPAVGPKTRCLCVFFYLSVTLRGQRAVRSRGHTLNKYYVAVSRSISIVYTFFHKWFQTD